MILQRALTPQMSWSYLSRAMDTVAGYVLNTADAVNARTPATLFALHGLGFPGSPHRADLPYLDVLRFESSELMTFTSAVGGLTPEQAAQNNGPFVERPPFAGNGYTAAWVAGGAPVPLWFLDACRLPPGAEIWRVYASGREQCLAIYRDVGYGWVGANASLRIESWAPPSPVMGPRASWADTVWPADLLPDGQTVALASADEPPIGGFERTPRGLWRRVVPRAEVAEYFDLEVKATWRSAPFRLVNRWARDGYAFGEVFYLGRNADIAEALGLAKLDAGVYEATVPLTQLADLREATKTPSAFAKRTTE